LSAALRRLERGDHHVYSQVEEETMVRSGWLIERQEKEFFSDVQQELHFAPNSAILLDFSPSSNDNGQGCCNSMLTQMISDAAHIPGTDHIYACVRGDDSCWRHAIENAGFNYRGSLFLTVRMGRSNKWTTLPAGEEWRVEEDVQVRRSR
jgi:hypothetical protein